MTPEQIREASAEALIPELAVAACKSCKGTLEVPVVVDRHWGDPNGQLEYHGCSDCQGAGLALPGLSRECRGCSGSGVYASDYGQYSVHYACRDCGGDGTRLSENPSAVKGSGRVPLQGAEAERALREAMNQDGEWTYGYIPEGAEGFIADMVHEIIWRQGPTYGPNYLTVLARAVALAYLRQSAS